MNVVEQNRNGRRAVLQKLVEAGRELKLDLEVALIRNADLAEQLNSLKKERRDLQKRIWRERQDARLAKESRDRWKALCRGYEFELGLRDRR